MATIAIMQPYFFPYAGYFRLFAAADLFVIYDCVQFPRRGWVHRNRLPDVSGEPRWLSLPLARAPRAVAIKDLRFSADADARLAAQMRRFPILGSARAGHPIMQALRATDGVSPVDYLHRSLAATCAYLGLSCEISRSSGLLLPPEIRGQERVLAIAEALGARRYVNASGGQALYEAQEFARRGIDLHILKPYDGPRQSMLHRMLSEPAEELLSDIRAQAS